MIDGIFLIYGVLGSGVLRLQPRRYMLEREFALEHCQEDRAQACSRFRVQGFRYLGFRVFAVHWTP